ncbi:MAG: TetR family transcriptional regulator [Saprospiraceae bacterium]|nr:TetR family transcriptional regulator [Saprospiraceae bacterium]
MINEKHAVFRQKALRLILEKGYKGATMRDFADALGCDVANIYNYIPSKKSFLTEELFQMSERFHEGLDQIIAAKLGVEDEIRQLVRLYVQLSLDYPLQVALLSNEWRHLDQPELIEFLDERNRYERKIRKIVGRGIKSGELAKINPDVATHLVLASLRWLFIYTSEQPVKNRITLENEILSFIFKGLLRPASG